MSTENHTLPAHCVELHFAIGYAVGRDGSTWSRWKRGRPGGLTRCWMPLKQSTDNVGYKSVGIKLNDGTRKTVRVHTLVLTAFVGPPPVGHEALHNNGDRTDPRLENLRWGTRSENMKDAVRHGTHVRTLSSGRRTLTADQVRRIPELRESGLTQEQVGKMFGVSQTCISTIELGKTWGHLE